MAAARERHLKFAALVHRGMTATDAARECGYKAPDKAGWRLSKDVHVCNEITRLRGEMIEKAHEVTTKSILGADEILEKLSEIANDDEIPAAAKIPALKLLGSHNRLWIERTEITETSVSESVKKGADEDLRHLKLVKSGGPVV